MSNSTRKPRYISVLSFIDLPAERPDDTLAEARVALRTRLASGTSTECSTCGQNCKIYPRAINKGALRALVALAKSLYLTGPQIRAASGSGDYANLAYHKLAEYSPDQSTWRITQRGRDFLRGSIKIAKSALIYNNRLLGFDGEDSVHVSDIDAKFDFEELMQSDKIKKARVLAPDQGEDQPALL